MTQRSLLQGSECANGRLPTYGTVADTPVQITVTNAVPAKSANHGSLQDLVNRTKEIWVQVLETAVAPRDGGYSAIQNGGSPAVAMEELTGKAATFETMTMVNNVAMVQLGNPCGFDQPAASPVSQLSKAFVEIDVGKG